MNKKITKFIVIGLVFLSVLYLYDPNQNAIETANRLNALAPRTLYWGSTGQDVRTVQDKLLRWRYYDGSVDGMYGARTYRAVMRFQQKNGLNPDGVVGASTAAAMGISTSSKPGSTQGINQNADEYLLARTIHGEARGEPYIGKVAVAAVVLNRVKSPSFPNTAAGVVYQPLAFTAVADGQINLTPNKDALNAARDALNGWDPTNGCLYYWNPATATSKWIWSRTVTLKIGKHWFGI